MNLQHSANEIMTELCVCVGITSDKTERLYKEMNRHISVTLSMLVDSQIHKSYELDLLMNWSK